MAFRIITNVTAYCVVTKQLTKHGGGQSNDESRVVGGSNLASIYSTILSTVSILPRCWETVLRRGTQRHQPRFQSRLDVDARCAIYSLARFDFPYQFFLSIYDLVKVGWSWHLSNIVLEGKRKRKRRRRIWNNVADPFRAIVLPLQI